MLCGPSFRTRRGVADDSAAHPALRIFPAEMQLVQTRTRLRVPFSVTMCADCRFGSQRRLVLLFAWLTLFPARGPLPQTAQKAAIGLSLPENSVPKQDPKSKCVPGSGQGVVGHVLR